MRLTHTTDTRLSFRQVAKECLGPRLMVAIANNLKEQVVKIMCLTTLDGNTHKYSYRVHCIVYVILSPE